MKNKKIEKAFTEYREVLLKVAARFVPSCDVEDIVQEAYLKTYQTSLKKEISSPKSYMFITTKNLALDAIKRAKHQYNEDMENFDFAVRAQLAADDIYDEVEFEEKFLSFCKSLRQLPAKCRKAYILKKVYGLTQKEIAEHMNISESTVEKHLALGLLRCDDYLTAICKPESNAVRNLKSRSKH